MYLNRNLKNHNLLQANARTNRPANGKQGEFGLPSPAPQFARDYPPEVCSP